jgi:threonine dehydrogenase-like Zn-dependent dehydrogenase
VRQGDAVLLHAGAGGVGLILTQWATSLGARVITTASTAHKAQVSRTAGAIEVLDYPDDPHQFAAKIRDLTGGEGVAAVYNGVGKSTFDARCQERVSSAWHDTDAWTRMSILNTARSGKFSSDRAIAGYCDEIWNVLPVTVTV